MRRDRTSRSGSGRRPVLQFCWFSVVAFTAALNLLAGCSSASGSASLQTTSDSTATSSDSIQSSGESTQVNPTSATTIAVESAPSVAPETTPPQEKSDTGGSGDGGNGGGGGGGDSRGTINVKAPTLGSNFTGTPGWGPNDVELADLHITIGSKDDEAHYIFGVFTINGEDGLTYGDTSLTPDGTHFHLDSHCAGRPIATSAAAVDHGDESARCSSLTFDLTSPAPASNPFDAQLVLRFQLTCGGQDSATCRQSAAARSASTAHPVVLQFRKSIKLHGSVQAPASVAAGDATDAAVVSAPPENASPSGNSGGSSPPPEDSLPAEASRAAPESTG